MNVPVPAAVERQNVDWLSVFQLGLSALAVFLLGSAGLGLLAAGSLAYFSTQGGGAQEGLPMLLMGAGLGASGLLVLPSAGLALARLAGWRGRWALPEISRGRGAAVVVGLPAAFGLVLLAGSLAARSEPLAALFLPLLQVLAIGLPVLWILYLAAHGLPLGSYQRRWGVFAASLVLGPALILVLETLALIGFALAAMVFVASQPELFRRLASLAQEYQGVPLPADQVFELLRPYLGAPAVFGVALLFGSVVVPLIEEALKPVGVWLLAGRPITPAGGLAAGLVSGAGYALFESLALTSGGADWAASVSLRLGTGVIHILTAGLTGWALVLAWQQQRYLRLAGTYLLAVLVHGLWNALALATVFADLYRMEDIPAPSPLFSQIGGGALVGLTVFALGGLGVLLALNRSLRAA